MTENSTPSRTASHRQNLVTSVNWASYLMSQVPRSAVPHGIPVWELALVAQLLLEQDIALLDGSPKEIDISVVLKSACARLGYQLIPANFPVEHYEVEVCQNGDNKFNTIVSCPESISLDEYISKIFNNSRDVYTSHKVIRKLSLEEVEIKISKILEGRKVRVSAPTALRDTSLSVGKLSTVPTVSPEERGIVEIVYKSGLLDVYGEVVECRNKKLGQGIPIDLATNFISFLRTVAVMKLPRWQLARLAQEFGGQIKVYKAQGISMVLSDKHIKMFLPTASFDPNLNKLSSPLHLHGITMARGGQSGETLASLIRRRAGYVPASCDIFTEALLHSIGSFGREMRSIPIKK